jgi:hypothetical protein
MGERRFRPSPALIRDAIKAIAEAGYKPGRVDMKPDGGFSVAILGEGERPHEGNPWDEAA